MRVVQILDALDFGDGVSNDVIQLHALLDEMGVENQIYSKWCDERVADQVNDIGIYQPTKDDLLIFHFSGRSNILEQVAGYPCRRIVRYHNVTPPEFFLLNNPQAYENCKEGLRQIKENIHRFDGFWADSSFNRQDLVQYGVDIQKVDVLPIILDFERLEKRPYNKGLLHKLKYDDPIILLVGRIAPNKRIEDILDAFENYYRYHSTEAKLYLVGNTEHSLDYTEFIQDKIAQMTAKEQVILTGKVSEKDLYAYYRAASVFLCMSEHEGFCIPLLEAQHFCMPVIGYASCAVPDTMGGSGVLVYKKNPAVIAYLLDNMIHDLSLRESILKKQHENISRYQRSAVQKKLSMLLQKWGQFYVQTNSICHR